jgi:phage terminase large subunit-like protein
VPLWSDAAGAAGSGLCAAVGCAGGAVVEWCVGGGNGELCAGSRPDHCGGRSADDGAQKLACLRDCGGRYGGAGVAAELEGIVLEDATVQAASPLEWARAAVAALHLHNADRLVAEVNLGGDMVEAIVRHIDPLVPYRKVTATKGKVARAEPVAALYEQGRVTHLRGLGTLEDQMCLMTTGGFAGSGSPDRVDALVWVLHELMIAPTQGWHAPQMRSM